MSSWSMLLALSGYEYDGPAGHLRFTPRHSPENHKSFFTGPEGWGTLRQTRHGGTQTNQLTMTEGRLRVARLHLDSGAKSAHVTVGGKTVKAAVKQAVQGLQVVFALPVVIEAGQSLEVRLVG
jgi:hypothetical protein